MIFENYEIALLLLRQFRNLQKCTRIIYPKSPKHVITSTNFTGATLLINVFISMILHVPKKKQGNI